jgi:DNA-directed RNA polymerase specialized sigma24 family protein
MPDAPSPTDETLLAQGHALRSLAQAILRGSDGADDVVQEAQLATLQRVSIAAGKTTTLRVE